LWDGETAHDIVVRTPTFFTSINYLLRDGELVHVDIPEDAEIHDILQGQLLVELKSDWEAGGKRHRQGSLLSIELESFLSGARDFQTVFEPGERTALSGVGTTRNFLLVVTLDMVKNRVLRYALQDGVWVEQPLELPTEGALAIGASSDRHDDFFYLYEDFVTPDSLYLAREGGTDIRLVRQLPAFFDTGGVTVEQRQARSADGTLIPYFLVLPKGFEADGSTPTLLYGYGGFEVSYEPVYSAISGHSWVARGGAYVLSNIRGGGEFGPKWHQAALKANRQKAYDDFIAIAEDLVATRVTSPEHLGIRGGSNGGLLVGNVFVQRPDLFDAVVCQVPLLDMKRYNKLLAGASWMDEYGDPDTDDWAFLQNYSPYHQVSEAAEYPRVFFTTSTRDDRVHPAHARKMVAKMTDQGHDVLYYENIEGGHAGAANLRQRAYVEALIYSYLWSQLGEP
ncbi:MAG: prolyl oligopeptidase family serine peptidase, partial [Xanthomonadales bacterium]|nr:prolyl oligopeptidase family serine peptidase [Xanthomonadales bacterium]